jgi:hypothetical protein
MCRSGESKKKQSNDMSVDRPSDGRREHKERQRIAAEPIKCNEKPDVMMKDVNSTDFFQSEAQPMPAK